MTAVWDTGAAGTPLSLDVPQRPSTLLWCAPFSDHSGQAEEARAFIRSLSALGWHIAARSARTDAPSVLETAWGGSLVPELRAAFDDESEAPLTAVLHLPGVAAAPVRGADRTIVRTRFGTDGLPAAWVERLNRVDEVWVASSFNARTFREAGVAVPVHVVPGGVDTELFRPGVDPIEIPGARGTVFLSVYESNPRKAPDVLLRAWAAAFDRDDPVTLVLTPGPRHRGEEEPGRHVDGLVDDELGRLGLERSQVAPIVVLGSMLAPRHMPRVLAAADVFVGVSRGEGWGQPLLEAMACGLPTIATRWGGPLDFMNDLNSLLVEVDHLVRPVDRTAPGSLDRQRWAEPSVTHLTTLLRQAASDGAMRVALGRRARTDARRRWRWHRASAIADVRLRDVSVPVAEEVGRERLRPVPAAPDVPDEAALLD